MARIARALNDAGIPCPSAADPGRNPHRTGAGWTLGTVTTIVRNPRYTGRQVWNRQRTDRDLADPADISPGHKPCSGGTCPTGGSSPASPRIRRWSARPISSPPRTSAPPAAPPRIGLAAPDKRRYLLAGLLTCGGCGRRMESAWSNGKPAYRCRHGHTTASRPDPGRPKNAYIREDRILPHLPALHLLLTEPAGRTAQTAHPPRSRHPAPGHCRGRDRVPARAGSPSPTTRPPEPCRQAPARPSRPLSGKQLTPAQGPRPEGGEENRRSPGPGSSLRPGDVPACHEIAGYGVLLCPRGDLNPRTGEISPVR